MDEVMDRVVETQLKIYYTICYRSFVFLVTGNLVYKCDDSCVGMAVGFPRRFEG